MKTISIPGHRWGYLNRMAVYFGEMFPLPERLLHATFMAASFLLLLKVIHGDAISVSIVVLCRAVAAVFGLALILRLMDELKDREIDRRLFAERPLASGRVREGDVTRTLIGTMILFPLAQIESVGTVIGALVLQGYAILMYHYFFVPRSWRSRLLVTVATHNPVVALLLFYLVVLSGPQAGRTGPLVFSGSTLVVVMVFWSLLLGWEVSRKIRYPREETEYITYSRLLGYRRAAVAVWVVQAVPVCGSAWLWGGGCITALFPTVAAAAFVWLSIDVVRFLTNRLRSGLALRAASERYALCVMAASLLEYGVREVSAHA